MVTVDRRVRAPTLVVAGPAQLPGTWLGLGLGLGSGLGMGLGLG